MKIFHQVITSSSNFLGTMFKTLFNVVYFFKFQDHIVFTCNTENVSAIEEIIKFMRRTVVEVPDFCLSFDSSHGNVQKSCRFSIKFFYIFSLSYVFLCVVYSSVFCVVLCCVCFSLHFILSFYNSNHFMRL